jgi:hypothetical protein
MRPIVSRYMVNSHIKDKKKYDQTLKGKIRINMKWLGTFFLVSMFVYQITAQTLFTKETKVVLVVDSKTESVNQIILLNKIDNGGEAQFLKKYAGSKFYGGLLKGAFELDKEVILPAENTTIIMFTEKQLFLDESYKPSEGLLPGDYFNLGRTNAKVVSRKKGELIVKT